MSVYFPDDEIPVLHLHLESCLVYIAEAINDVIKESPDGDAGLDEFEKHICSLNALLHEREDVYRLLSYLPKEDECRQH